MISAVTDMMTVLPITAPVLSVVFTPGAGHGPLYQPPCDPTGPAGPGVGPVVGDVSGGTVLVGRPVGGGGPELAPDGGSDG